MIKIETVGKPYMRYLAKVIPLAFDESMSYYEQLCSFRAYLINEIAPVINNNAEALQELINYIENLDLQNEIDNKLDEMYQNGQLENIISEFIELSTTYSYANIDALSNAENLVENCYVRTNGYYSLNDGGGALYYVRALENNEVINGMNLIELHDENLVAEIVPVENTLTTSQLGFVEDDNNETRYPKLSNIIKSYNIHELIFDKDYGINAQVTFEEINNLTLNFKNKITAVSYNLAEYPILTIKDSHDIEIKGYNITSTLDKEERAPSDHVRENYAGSGRIGIKIDTSKNIYIKDCIFENMNWNFYPLGTDENELSENIYIENCQSTNSSIDLYSSHIKNINITNYKSIPKEELGAGNHVFYFGRHTTEVTLSNIDITSDGYLGYPIAFNNPGDAGYNKININNCKIKGTGIIYFYPSVNNANINNIQFEYVDNEVLVHDTIQLNSTSNSEVYFNNIYVNNKNNTGRFLRVNSNGKIEFNNLRINSTYEDNRIQSIVFGSTNNNVIIRNSYIKCQIFTYIGGETNNNNTLDVINTVINSTSDTYFQSVRNNSGTTKATYINCFITCKNNENFSYQAGVMYEDTVYLYGCYLNGFDEICSTPNDTGFNFINCYKDGTLITTW